MKHILTLAAAGVFLHTALIAAPQQAPQPRKLTYTPLSQLEPDEYLPSTFILKVKPQYRANCAPQGVTIPSVSNFLTMIGADQVSKMFPNHKAPERTVNQWGQPMIDLSTIYVVHYTGAMPLERAIGKLYNTGYFEYVEPYFVPKAGFTPNDPQATSSSSYHIYRIAAASTSGMSGWDVSTGSSSVVIGITDTGVELTHSDLTNQIAYNTADPINGNDDDNDGFIDNYRGWDVGMNDNDPTWQANAHGVHVSGCAAAQVNNNLGVAGAGFNCKFLPVKIADASGALVGSYQGITYAADHGCKIINCSWGGTGGGSFGQNIIDYATNNMDAAVVCAAGNNGVDQAFYPAAYDRVLSVASTSSTDAKSSFSNFNYTVDISSPGSNVNSTWSGNGYTQSSGTSMASPVAAGALAIVRAFYPTYNATQAMRRLIETTDNIYSVSPNGSYLDKLGTGRVNLYKALTDPAGPSVMFLNRTVTDNNDNAYVIGDTLRVRGDFTNYLAPASNVTATLTVVSGGTFVTIIDGTTTIGALGTLVTATNNSDPFTISVNTNAPSNQPIVFRVAVTDGSWTRNFYFTETVNVDYINVTVNDVWTTITSRGLIGYNQDQQQQGLGFNYQQNGSLLYEAGLMIGTPTKVSDVVRGTGSTPDVDFASVQTVRQIIPTVASDFDLTGRFNDAPSSSGALPVTVTHNAYAWSSAPHTKYVIVEYIIRNTGTTTLNNLHAGIFADWDIDASTYNDNKSNYDAVNKMGYTFHTAANGFYCGIKLLTNTAPPVHYAIDNVNGGNGGVDMFNGYDNSEKYTTLSTNRSQAGNTTSTGNDVIDVMSSGPFNIAAGDSVVVAFALIAGDDLADIQSSAVNAQINYDTQVPLSVSNNAVAGGVQIFPNPTTGNTEIRYTQPQNGAVNLTVLDASGRLVSVLATGNQPAGNYNVLFDAASVPAGVYFCRIETATGVETRKLIVTH
ncbi:MAG: S8 family peptidase [Bacteroidia bacterium]|jgi:subtilisin family serine protease|nr:S8 family peptidase [Bacteroidia bacterium]